MKVALTVTVSIALDTLRGVAASQATRSAPRCKCLSTDQCWPSSAAFSELQAQLSQPLLAPVPPAAACYPATAPSGDCATVQQFWTNGTWHSDQPGSMQASNWDNYILKNGTISACYLDTTLGAPCEQGSVPIIGVDTRTPEDVQAAVKFASRYNLRVVVKNTGHDYLGRSTARGSFLIWTHFMKNITFHESFKPAGAPRSVAYENVVTLGAGVQWHEAYAAVIARGRNIVGGISAGGSVGAAGGWVQGGGHSILSPTYGLGVDNVVEITVVAASGTHVTANAHRNSDLFWALRGGGGGTFGVITSVTYKTHPSTPIIAGFFTAYINTTIPNATIAASPTLRKLYAEFLRQTPAMADGGWAGYAYVQPTSPTNAPSLQVFYIAPNVSWAAANATVDPFFFFAQHLAATSSIESGGKLTITFAGTFPMDSFAQWYTEFFFNMTGQVGSPTEIASRLLPRSSIVHDSQDVADTLLSMPYPLLHLVAGGAVSEADPSSTGLNPAWRKALLHAVVGVGWPEGASSAVIEHNRDILKGYVTTLHNLAPNSGAYINEASLYEINSQQTFFGSHYPQLKAIKNRWDPNGLFIVAEGVGSEEWDATLRCRT